jgi:hypothetical protein
MTSMPIANCAPTPACVALTRGQGVGTTPWLGTTCGQCACDESLPRVPAPAGEYRVVAQSCDGTIDYVAANNQPTLTLPPLP